MRHKLPAPLATVLVAVPLLLGAAAAPAEVVPREAPLAPTLEGLGDHTFPVTSTVEGVQRFFDQGLILAYGFNHAEAERSFREAARLDPGCAICWWGVALVLGPNINAPMDPANGPKAWEALGKAERLAPGADARERAYIEALSARYAAEPPADRTALDRAYAEAMRKVAQRFPEDTDASTLFAEALMNLMPWDYWLEDGRPRPATVEALEALESVFAREPEHPGANHFYIHLVEKEHPERGVAAARRLDKLIPGAGHLVHMPSHIYMNLGWYHEATEVNLRAVAADREYLTQCHAQGLYPVAYTPHNYQFLWAAATFEGRRGLAIEAARKMSGYIERQHAAELRGDSAGTAQHFWVTPLFAQVRFGEWDALLAAPEPPRDLLYPRGIWHYARGIALVRKGRLDEAAGHLERLTALVSDPALEGMTFWGINPLSDLLAVARQILAGELAAARGDHDRAIAELERGVAAEDALIYDDPPDWHHPVRQVLGAVLLEAGRPQEAERVYREDLDRFPANGWSLHGLAKAQAAQGKKAEARATRRALRRAWAHADVKLTASRM